MRNQSISVFIDFSTHMLRSGSYKEEDGQTGKSTQINMMSSKNKPKGINTDNDKSTNTVVQCPSFLYRTDAMILQTIAANANGIDKYSIF